MSASLSTVKISSGHAGAAPFAGFARPRRAGFSVMRENSCGWRHFLLKHDVVRTPASTLPDHALLARLDRRVADHRPPLVHLSLEMGREAVGRRAYHDDAELFEPLFRHRMVDRGDDV